MGNLACMQALPFTLLFAVTKKPYGDKITVHPQCLIRLLIGVRNLLSPLFLHSFVFFDIPDNKWQTAFYL